MATLEPARDESILPKNHPNFGDIDCPEQALVERTEPPLIVIVGPTASGKTSLAIDLAEQIGGEIICADSRTVYKGMDIGTAKPSLEDQARVPHWGIDLVEPSERFTAANFKEYAAAKIREIRSRGRVPFLVGGTGLYVDGILFDYQFNASFDESLRAELGAMSIEQLHGYCSKNNIILPENRLNKRYVIRAIEQKGGTQKREPVPITNSIVVGLAIKKEALRTTIVDRAEQIFDNNVVEEATILSKKYGWKNEAMTGNIYPLVWSYLEGEYTLEQIKDKFTTLDVQLAKRQMTWFRRNPFVLWLAPTEAKLQILEMFANRRGP